MDLVPKNVHVDKIDENGSSVNTEHWNRLLKKDLTPQVPSNLPNKALFRFSKNLFGQTNNEIMVIGCSTERSASRLYIGRILCGTIQVHSSRLKVNSSTSKIKETRFFDVITDANVHLEKRVERRRIYIPGTHCLDSDTINSFNLIFWGQ